MIFAEPTITYQVSGAIAREDEALRKVDQPFIKILRKVELFMSSSANSDE
jgi:hypothetical protein